MKTGLRINELAARQIENQRWVKRVIAEMGGKDAMVIDDSADLDAAAADIVASAYGYSGQKCSAACRAILHTDVHDEVLNKVVEKAKALKVGVPERPDVNIGPGHKRAPVREGCELHGRWASRRGTASWAGNPAIPTTVTSCLRRSSRSSLMRGSRRRRFSAPSSPS